MKLSKYNFFSKFRYENTNKIIAYNAITNSLAVMEETEYDLLIANVDNIESISDKQLLNALAKGKFIIDDSVNERDILTFNMYKARFNNDNLVLTIAPTQDCNFRCVYCYEKKQLRPVYMDDTTQANIVNFVKSNIKGKKSLNISWYGGEPLLCFEIIQKLAKEFIDICNENNVVYLSHIVTNGYLLNREIARCFKELKIVDMQITLDGTSTIHDKRRKLKNGSPTFDTILKNIVECKDLLPKCAIRINLDKANSNEGEKLISMLKEMGLLDLITPYFAMTINQDGCYESSYCMNTEEFYNSEYNYFKNGKYPCDTMIKYPRSTLNFCMADYLNGYVINADGLIYKCWNQISNTKYSIGDINNLDLRITPLLTGIMLYNPFEDEECVNCKTLPLCMGGCSFKRLTNGGRCSPSKYFLTEYLEIIARDLINK